MYGLLCKQVKYRNKKKQTKPSGSIRKLYKQQTYLVEYYFIYLSHLFFDEGSYYVAQVIILDPPDFALNSWDYRQMLPGLASDLSS